MSLSSHRHVYIYVPHGLGVSRLTGCISVRLGNKVYLSSVSVSCALGQRCTCICYRTSVRRCVYVHVKKTKSVRRPHQNKQVITNNGLHNRREHEKGRKKEGQRTQNKRVTE
jgi:hypothetical protein